MEFPIVTQNLSKKYGDFTVVSELSLRVKRGSFFGFLGPNGAGKTTTIKMLAGLLRPTSGNASVLGYDTVIQGLEVKRYMGLVSDEPALYEYLTAREFLRFVGGIYRLSKAQIAERTEHLLEMMTLSNKGDSLSKELSFGMRKKLELAAALLHDPQVLLLDEPFTGIDPIDVRVIKDALAVLTRRGVTIFMSSHVLEMVEKLCDEVAILHQGRLVGQGTTAVLREQAKTGADSSLEEVFLKLVEAPHKETSLWSTV